MTTTIPLPTGRRAEPPGGEGARLVRRRRPLPGGRAVLGGLLVATALLGTWWAGARTRTGATSRYLVAARPLAPGSRITADDLRAVTVDLPPRLRSHGLADAAAAVGQIVVAPLAAGDLVQASAVAPGTGSRSAREVSFVIDAEWAAGGVLRPGDRIDLLVTYGEGTASSTSLVAAALPVRRVAESGADGLGGHRRLTLTVSTADLATAEAVTNAARAGTITIARATGARAAGAPPPYVPTTTEATTTTTKDSATTTTRRHR